MTAYDTIKALNWSSLKHMATSALELRYRVDHPEPRKLAYILGGAIHCRTLEPEHFAARYAICEVRRDARTAAYKDWLAEHDGVEPLKPEEMACVEGAAEAVLSHRVAGEIIRSCRHEEPMTWTDPDNGLSCKGRLDAICPEFIADLKMTRDPSPRAFGRAAAGYLYHGQIAFYHHGALALRKIPGNEMPRIIAVAGKPPHDVAVYRLRAEDLKAGRVLCLSLMRKYQECIAADYWPGCAPDMQDLEIPPWAPGMVVEQEEEW